MARSLGLSIKQEEASIAGRLALGQERKADPLGLGNEEELEVLVEFAGIPLEADDRFSIALAVDRHIVARAIDRPERVGTLDRAPPS